ncbi:MAG: penicillin-binding protein 1C [Verrucomicrobiales bacterium]|jgi:penicillin-binding protein 1C|nr:penicillin-binding protein 1C [Verrucomicrobiales bacterium]
MPQNKWLRRIAWTCGSAALLFAGLWLFTPKPDLWQGVSFSHCYYDRDGKLLRVTTARDQRYRIYTPYNEISPLAVEATLLHEDRYFNLHPGFNPIALGKATLNELVGFHRRVGASTISMQLARIRYRLNTRTIGGKLTQILRACQIELFHSKQEILEAYLNQASYGRNIEGIGTAALIYYGKPARDLTLAEALTLSVIPQSPARRAPRYAHENRGSNAELLKARKILFTQWLAVHPQDANYEPTLDMALQVRTPHDLPFFAPHFTDQMERANRQPYLVTTLSLASQQLVERTITQYVAKQQANGIKNASALLVDINTMGVVAEVGSADYFNREIHGQVNGTTMRRSPGSTLKPLLYALAMDEGLIQPHSLLKDEPSSFADYNPENYDKGFVGPIQAADALRQSRNVPAVYLLFKLKKKTLYQLLQEAGIKYLKPESHYGLTLALGSAEISPVELAQLYAMLANRGKFRTLTTGLNPAANHETGKQLISPESCFLALDILKQTPRPGSIRSSGLRDANGGVAWKTGTSWSYRDAWSVAVFDHYVLVIWVGNFAGESSGNFVGRSSAAPLLFNIIDTLRAREPSASSLASWENPSGLNLTRIDLCALNGEPANRHCPQTVKGWFIPGVSPIQPCTVHQAVWINPATGLRVRNKDSVPNARQEVYEIWPSDLQALFKKAGLPRRQPPSFEGERAVSPLASTNNGPVIKSPRESLTYALPLTANGDEQKIILQASATAGTESLYWFVDSVFVGRCKPEETLTWKARVGVHQIAVADDKGRTAVRQLTVEAAQ